MTTITTIIGIDPGASGGIVSLEIHAGWTAVETNPMPDTEGDVWNVINRLTSDGRKYGEVRAVIEQVQGYIGGEGHPGATMFKFGMGYGGLRMALLACGIPFTAVTPAVWQKRLEIPKRGTKESKTEFKNRLKAKAQQLFPRDLKGITLKTCDALLLAEYGRRFTG